MTSFIIKTQLERQNQPWKDDSFCAFCKIVSGELQAFRVYENDKVIAILGTWSPDFILDMKMDGNITNNRAPRRRLTERHNATPTRAHPGDTQSALF